MNRYRHQSSRLFDTFAYPLFWGEHQQAQELYSEVWSLAHWSYCRIQSRENILMQHSSEVLKVHLPPPGGLVGSHGDQWRSFCIFPVWVESKRHPKVQRSTLRVQLWQTADTVAKRLGFSNFNKGDMWEGPSQTTYTCFSLTIPPIKLANHEF